MSGELNDAAIKKYDLEGWFPGQVSHESLCADDALMRLMIRISPCCLIFRTPTVSSSRAPTVPTSSPVRWVRTSTVYQLQVHAYFPLDQASAAAQRRWARPRRPTSICSTRPSAPQDEASVPSWNSIKHPRASLFQRYLLAAPRPDPWTYATDVAPPPVFLSGAAAVHGWYGLHALREAVIRSR